MKIEDKTSIEMLEQFGADQHFNIAKCSAIVCIDQIINTIFKYGTVVEAHKSEDGILFWNKVKMRIWEMRVKEYAKTKGIDY